MALTQVQGGMILPSGQSIPKAALPAGTILQVVSGNGPGVTASTNTYTSTSRIATASVSITPTSASSKVYVTYSAWWYPYDSSASTSNQVGMSGGIYRNGSAIQGPNHWQLQVNGAATYTYYGMPAFCVLDAPSTTSAITYSMEIYGWSGNPSTVVLRETGGNIIAMEVAQ